MSRTSGERPDTADRLVHRRPRVLMLVDALHDGVGGAERFAVGLATALPRDRFEVSLCATHGASGYLVDALASAGVGHFVLERRGRFDLLAWRRLVDHLRRERVGVLHAHKFGSNLWGSLLGRACRVPVVLAHEHTWSYEGQPLRRLLDGHVIGRLSTRFVAVSRADRERMVSIEGVRPDKAIVIPTAYVPRLVGGRGDLREELGLPRHALVVGTIAQLRPQKALHVMIAAFERVGRRFADAHLVIVGDGPCRQGLERRAASSNVAGRVHFAGVRTDVDAVLAGLDVAVMSSDFEGLPLFAFECMAHGTPLVATRVGGLPDVVEHGVSGLLVPPGQPAALADSVEGLLADPERRDALAARAREHVREFSIDLVAERFADLYDRLLHERGSPKTLERAV